MARRSMALMQKTASSLLLVGSSLVAVVLAELALRALTPQQYYVYPPGLARTFRPVPDVMPGVTGDSRFTINDVGIRGPQFADTDAVRILAVGGSTTECLYLDQAEAWPQVLQDLLNRGQPNVWVGNVGKSGHDARHHLLQVEHLLDQYPRIDVVLLLVGVNDLRFWLNSFDDADRAASRYVIDDTVWDEAFMVRPGRTVAFVQRGEVQRWQCVTCGEPFYKQTEIWRRLRVIKRAYTAPPTPAIFQDESGQIYLTARQRRMEASKEARLPNLTRGLAAYTAYLERISDVVERQGAQLVLITQPFLWTTAQHTAHERLLFMGGPIAEHPRTDGEVYYATEALAEGMAHYNAALLRLCAARQLPCLDLAARIPKDTHHFYDDVHFNEAGAAKVAQVLADHLFSLIRSRLSVRSDREKVQIPHMRGKRPSAAIVRALGRRAGEGVFHPAGRCRDKIDCGTRSPNR